MEWRKEDLLRKNQFGADYQMPFYSSKWEDAMLVADKMQLFEQGFVLHKIKSAYNQVWKWHISRMDDRGVLQGFVAEDTPELAICHAALKITENDNIH